jgi:flagellin-like protein
MKGTRKICLSGEGVSPVIATILMVAITVVLAAVLYVMVIGFGGGAAQAPPGNIYPIEQITNTSVKIPFGPFEPTPKPMDLRVMLTSEGGAVQISFSGPLTGDDTDMVVTGCTNATYHDFNYNGQQVNNGDYIIIEGLEPYTTYTISVYHFPSDSLCPLTGHTSFTTMP